MKLSEYYQKTYYWKQLQNIWRIQTTDIARELKKQKAFALACEGYNCNLTVFTFPKSSITLLKETLKTLNIQSIFLKTETPISSP